MKKPLVIANWKLSITTPEEAKKLAAVLRRKSRMFSGVDVTVAPSFVHLPVVLQALKGSSIKVAAQTAAPSSQEKQTGSISAGMLKSLGVTGVIVGHSERRSHGETNSVVEEISRQVREAGLTVVLCVGELERDSAGGHFGVIQEQLTSALKNISKTVAQKIVIAYEPVWAIGKTAGEAMQPADLQEMVIFIRKTLADIVGRADAVKIPILYGGSVEGSNAKSLIQEGGVSGFLVGHASASSESFLDILLAVK